MRFGVRVSLPAKMANGGCIPNAAAGGSGRTIELGVFLTQERHSPQTRH